MTLYSLDTRAAESQSIVLKRQDIQSIFGSNERCADSTPPLKNSQNYVPYQLPCCLNVCLVRLSKYETSRKRIFTKNRLIIEAK